MVSPGTKSSGRGSRISLSPYQGKVFFAVERALIGFLGRGPQVLLQEIPQLAGPCRVSKLAKRFGFYLTNTFPGHTELLTRFF